MSFNYNSAYNYLGAKKCCASNLYNNYVSGPQGAQGPQGAIGPAGLQGNSGPTGPTGAQGACCRGPQGFQGSTGPTGPQGAQGPTGPQGSKTFIIDHPSDTNKYLVHACVEGPEAGVYYRGKGAITNGVSTIVHLPPYVSAFNNFTIQLTQKYSVNCDPIVLRFTDVSNNMFHVYGNNCEFHWLVFAERHRIDAEPYKHMVNINGNGPYKWIS